MARLNIGHVDRPGRSLWYAVERIDGWFWSTGRDQWSRGVAPWTQARLAESRPGYYEAAVVLAGAGNAGICVYILEEVASAADRPGRQFTVVDVQSFGDDPGDGDAIPPAFVGPAAARARRQRAQFGSAQWLPAEMAVEAADMGISYRRGRKFDNGVEISALYRYRFYGDDEFTIHTATLWRDGTTSCNCPRWTRNVARECPHVTVAATLTADRNDTEEPIVDPATPPGHVMVRTTVDDASPRLGRPGRSIEVD